MSSADQLQLALKHWPAIEERVANHGPGPWSLTLTEAGLSDSLWVPRST
jgi:hypothetical protein